MSILAKVRPQRATLAGVRTFIASSRAPQQSWDDDDSRQLPPHQTRWQDRSQDKPRKSPAKSPEEKERLKQVQRDTPPLPLTEKEITRRALGRVQRAERLERKDLTAQLTATKTYMGGFTQPRHLAFLNTLDPTRKPKDSYAVRVGASRVRPDAEAYEPHIVYLAVTRYPVRWGHGRATRRECFSGFCKESELAERFRLLNGWRVSGSGYYVGDSASNEYLEQAVWPGSPQARSLANKYRSAELKKRLKDGELTEEIRLSPLLPPVVGWERPLPPYTTPVLIMPLLTVTLPTRPLASTLARLCNAFERGLPFYASVPNPDRKDGPSFFRRLLRLRANRIQELTATMVDRLQGNGGGFFGIRLGNEDKGRGVEGEMLSEPLAEPQRGWAVVRWLEDDSEGWEGLERENYQSSWESMSGVRNEPGWTDLANPVGVEVEAIPEPIRKARPPEEEILRKKPEDFGLLPLTDATPRASEKRV